MKKIYLAGGCFWGVEHYFKKIDGVLNTKVGYTNGNTKNPSYQDIKNTGHAEAIEVIYDENLVDLGFLLDMYYKVIDPTSVNRQGGDIGIQYRTGIYYDSSEDLQIIEKSISNLENLLNQKTVIEVMPVDGFYDAEEYHQDYLSKNPTGYCHIGEGLFKLAEETKAKKLN